MLNLFTLTYLAVTVDYLYRFLKAFSNPLGYAVGAIYYFGLEYGYGEYLCIGLGYGYQVIYYLNLIISLGGSA